jgi:hypothetical protein
MTLNRGSAAEERQLAALAARTPETPEEEEALMAALTAVAVEKTVGQPPAAQQGNPQLLAKGEASIEVGFETVLIRQGARLLYSTESSPAEWAVLGNTAQALLGRSIGALEHFETRGEGVASTWILGKPPGGKEDLLLEARLTGLNYAGDTPLGHHFADAGGTARLRVGNVTVVDSAGTMWPVPLQVRDQSLVVTVPHTILGQAIYPLAVDPLIAPEFGMDAPVLGPAPAAQQNPAVASNGTNLLVVWEDERIPGPNGPSIYGARVTGAGVVADPNGIAMSPTGASFPTVAPNGTGYLVVWSDGRNLATSGLDIFGARVTSAGQVLDAGGIPICTAAGDQFSPAATANGGGSFVVWQDGRNLDTGPDIYGARVTSGGVVSDTVGIAISTAAGAQASPAVAFNGQEFLVVWADQQGGGDFETRGARVSTGAVVLDTSGITISGFGGGEFFPKTAALGTNFLVVWEDHRNQSTGGFSDIFAGRVTGGGTVLDRDGFPVGTGSGDRFMPAVAAGLTDYLVVWQDSRNLGTSGEDIFGARVSTGGVVTDANGFPISTAPGDESTPALAFNGSHYLVVWSDQRNLATTDGDIYGTLVSTDATVASPSGIVISSGSADEQRPAVASNGSNYLVVWQDYRNTANNGVDIYGVRVGISGGVLDLSAIPISAAGGDQILPAVAASGTGYMVVWQDYRNSAVSGADIYGTLVTSGGTVVNASGIPISTANTDQLFPAVIGNGTDYFVAWQDGRNLANSGFDIYGTRVTGAGVVQDASGLALTQAAGAQYSPALAFNGTDYLVAWSDERNLGTSGVDIYGTRLTPAGTVLDPGGIPITQAAGDQVSPAVASASGGFLVVWEDGRNSATTLDDIYGARLNGAGVVLDPGGIPIAVAPDFQALPAAASTRTNYLVVWQDARNSATSGIDIYGARVMTDGTVQDPAGLALNTGASDQQSPKLASGSLEVLLLVAQSLENGARRAVGNFVYLEDFPIITHISFSGSTATLTWLSVPGRTYRVQFKPDLALPSWTDLTPDVTATGTTSTKVDNTLAGASRRYYRIVLLP